MSDIENTSEVCLYCGCAGGITRERRPDGYTHCNECGVTKRHKDWEDLAPRAPMDSPRDPTPEEEEANQFLVSIAPDRASETADFRDDFTVALGDKLHPDVYGRLEALDELYGEIGAKAVLSMLITEAYMDRVAAFREAEGE
jgi:hypothetical protein